MFNVVKKLNFRNQKEEENNNNPICKTQPLTVRNFEHIACFLNHPDDIYSLAVTCRHACEGCDSNLVWSILTLHVFHEILPMEKPALSICVGAQKWKEVQEEWRNTLITEHSRFFGVPFFPEEQNNTTNNNNASGAPVAPNRNVMAAAAANRKKKNKNNNQQASAAVAAPTTEDNNNNNHDNNDEEEPQNKKLTTDDLEEKLEREKFSDVYQWPAAALLPWRGTIKQSGCLHGALRKESKAAIEIYIPSIIFDCEAFQEFRLRALLSLDICERYSPIELDLQSLALKNLQNYENLSLAIVWMSSQHRNQQNIFASGREMYSMLLDNYDDDLIDDSDAITIDTSSKKKPIWRNKSRDAARSRAMQNKQINDRNDRLRERRAAELEMSKDENKNKLPRDFSISSAYPLEPKWLKEQRTRQAHVPEGGNAENNYLSVSSNLVTWNRLYQNIYTSNMVKEWRRRIRESVNDVRAAQDVLVSPDDNNINKCLNWKIQAASAGGHSLVKYTSLWRVPFLSCGLIYFIGSLGISIPIGVFNVIAGFYTRSSAKTTSSSGSSGNYFAGVDYDAVTNASTAAISATTTQTLWGSFRDKVWNQSANNQLSVCWRFPTSIFGETGNNTISDNNNHYFSFASSSSMSDSSILRRMLAMYFDNVAVVENNNNSQNIVPTSTPFLCLLGFAFACSVLVGFCSGRFPRMQGVPKIYRKFYLRHKILHDFFSAWQSRLNDFWVYVFLKSVYILSCSAVIPDTIEILKVLFRSLQPLWPLAMYLLQLGFSLLIKVKDVTILVADWMLAILQKYNNNNNNNFQPSISSAEFWSQFEFATVIFERYDHAVLSSSALTTNAESVASFVYENVSSAANFLVNLPCSSDSMKVTCVGVSLLCTVFMTITNHTNDFNIQFLQRSQAAAKPSIDELKKNPAKKHQKSRFLHVWSDVFFNASLCLLRWNMYFSLSTTYEKDGFFHALAHFGKCVGLEFLLRSSSSVFEYVNTAF